MNAGVPTAPPDGDLDAVRLQAEEHPLIEDDPPTTPAEHCLRLMHLRAYDEAVAHATGRDVLDVGCNTGYGTIRFVPVASRVVGVDVSERAIEAARRRAPDGRPEFIATDGFDLPFADASFDLVTSFQVLEHVPDPRPYLAEIRRVTRPGGTVILATPNAATRLDPGMTPWNRFHVREYVATELATLLEGTFSRVRIQGMFGAPTLYETEIRRVNAARQRIRRKLVVDRHRTSADARPIPARSGPPVRATSARPRSLPIRLARAMTPSMVRRWLREMVATAPATHPTTPVTAPAGGTEAGPDASLDAGMSFETFLAFTVADLFYADHDLDRAMALVAICEVG